jgi:hypothetical protein
MSIEVAGVVARLGFRVDSDGAERYERKIRDLRGDAKKDVVVPLRGDLQRRDLDLYEKKLDEIRTRVRRREDFKAQLGADYDARAFNAFERDQKRLQRETDNTVRSQGRLRTAFGSVSAGGAGVFAAAGGGYALYAGLKSIISASGEAEASSARLKTQVEALGRDYDKHAEKIDRVIQKTSLLAGLDDEELADAFTNIARTSGSVQDGLEGIGIAADIARARGIDVAKAGDLVGKVYAGNFTALKRYGIVLEENATTEEAVAAIQEKFAGQARARGRTQQGAIDRLKVAWENLQETLGKRVAPIVTDVANKLGKFITQMAEGEGAGGRFVEKLEQVWKVIRAVAERFDEAQKKGDRWEAWVRRAAGNVKRWIGDAMGDIIELGAGVVGVFADIARAGAKLKIPGMKDAARELGEMEKSLDKTARKMHGLGDEADKVDMSKVRSENRKTAKAFRDMADDGKVSLRDIDRTTDKRMREIKQSLGKNSEEGRKALAGNFREAIDAVYRQMERGKGVTERGLDKIRGYLSQELKIYGLSIAEGKKITGTHPFADQKKAGGGWIGGPGQVGQDTVPAMLAPGEAVLNRHQQAVIEGMLGGGFLDNLFSRVQTPHYLARGGIVGLGRQLQREGYAVGEHPAFGGVGGGHAQNSYHYRGMALDVNADHMQGGEAANLDRLYGRLKRMPGVLELLWRVAGHFDHLHVALGGGAGRIGGALAKIAGVSVRGGGDVGRVVQGALSMARAGAQKNLERAAGSMSTPHPSGGGHAGNRALGRRMLGSFGWGANQFGPLNQLWTGESGWNHLARNPSSGAYGIPQALPGSKMASAGGDWQSNPATQIKWGLGYIRERYGSPAGAYRAWQGRSPHWYARGGRVGFAGAQAVTNAAANAAEGAARYAIGRPDRRLRRRANTRIGSYEAAVTNMETLATQYELADRRYGRSDEVFIRDDGSLDEGAVAARVAELDGLIALRQRIVDAIEEAARQARRVVQTLTTIMGRLRRSLRHAKGKDRSGIRSQIDTIGQDIETYTGYAQGHERDALFGREDLADLIAERDSVKGTTAKGDTATSTSTDADAQAIADQATARANAATADLAAVRANFAAFTSTGDIGSAQGTSALGSTLVDAAGGVGGAYSAGVGGGFIAGAGSTVVIVNSQSLVPAGHAENVRTADAIVTAISARPVRPVTQATVG